MLNFVADTVNAAFGGIVWILNDIPDIYVKSGPWCHGYVYQPEILCEQLRSKEEKLRNLKRLGR